MKTSIALCTYNGAKFLEQQLNSIAEQSVLPDELIVFDDLSQDSTWDILEDFRGRVSFNVRLTRNEVNTGAIKNFESALSRCTGDIVFLCDQDDIWPPEKIEIISREFAASPNLQMVFTDANLVDENLNRLDETLWKHMGLVKELEPKFRRDPFDFLLTDHNVVTGATAAFSKNAVQVSLPFPDPIAIFHDGWLALIASAIGPVLPYPQALLQYRQHPGQQLGVRKLSPDFDASDYSRHLSQLLCLQEKTAGELSPAHRQLLNDFIEHLRVRVKLSSSPVARTVEVVSEMCSGRYGRYSSGFRSAAKDVLRKR